jgi:DNA-binding transcriptional MerR regulator
MEQEATLTLEELSSQVTDLLARQGLLSGQPDNRVSAAPDTRTIRYYTTLGLLDRPMLAGRQARYQQRHVLQLLAIKALQGLSLPLAEIQARLYGRSNQELEALLSTLAGNRASRPQIVQAVMWREVTIEPGLKVMAEAGWQPGADIATLTERISATLQALKDVNNK